MADSNKRQSSLFSFFSSKKDNEQVNSDENKTKDNDSGQSVEDTALTHSESNGNRSPKRKLQGLVEDTKRSDSKSKHRRVEVKKFPTTWLTKWDWLEYDAVENVMFCRVCKKSRRCGPWATTGTSNFR